jgi:hypothetical protein
MNRNESTPAVVLYYFGWALIVVGVITGLYTGFTLDVAIPGYNYVTDPHPLRWTYGVATIISSVVFGLILIGISEIIAATLEKGDEQSSIMRDLLREARESKNKTA